MQIVDGLHPFVLPLIILGLQASPETLVAHVVANGLFFPASAEESDYMVPMLVGA